MEGRILCVVDLAHLHAQVAQQAGQVVAAGAVERVHHHAQVGGAYGLYVHALLEGVEVGGHEVGLLAGAALRGGGIGQHGFHAVGELLARCAAVGHAQLHAQVLGRVVAAGEHDAAHGIGVLRHRPAERRRGAVVLREQRAETVRRRNLGRKACIRMRVPAAIVAHDEGAGSIRRAPGGDGILLEDARCRIHDAHQVVVCEIFTDDGENSGGSIFELQCTATAALPQSDIIGSQFCEVQGVRGADQWDLGWGWHMATELMAQAYEPGDPRKNATLLYFRRSDSEPITPENTNEPYGESPVSPAIGAYFNKKAYTDPALRKEYTNKGYWVNIRLIRYADVLLMGAESANEKGISGEAIDYLEQVRARARGTNTNILPKVTTTDQGELREAIRHERRVELGLEFDRFYDLVRWGIAKEVLQAAGKNYQDKNALLPLPQTEIDKSKGVLVQNPDYQ